MGSLHPCSGCARHVRGTESACPFCGATVTAPPPRVAGHGNKRLTRAAILFATATTAAAAVACGKTPAEPDKMLVQPYGVPVTPPTGEPIPPDAGAADPAKPEAGAASTPTTPVAVPPYGVPVIPPDTGARQRTSSPPTNAAPAYGVPPPKH